MATRREFTFGSLVLALTGSQAARAGMPKAASPARVKVEARARMHKKQVVVDLTVELRADGPVDTVVERGGMPGPWLYASIVDAEGVSRDLAIVYEGDRREMFRSRMGPIPTWAPVAANEPRDFGPYKFSLPPGVPAPREVKLVGGIETKVAEAYDELAIELTVPVTSGPSQA